ncbi:hypothetical protein PHMEG_00034682, partial [Phytophthora megakarya]
LNPPLFPAEASVPHYSDLKIFMAAEIYPWDPLIVGTVPIIAMIQATLTKRMPIPANFLFPHRVPPVRAPQPVVGYCSGLINGANVLALMATEPLEEGHMIANWESTHYLEITTETAKADTDLFTYHADRRLRRAKWADIDILLDPYFLHLPTKQDRPIDLITALFECDQTDPWINHFRDPGSIHREISLAS